MVTTMHGRLDLPDLQPLYREFDDVPLVSISDAQRRPLPNANWAATIYHGIDLTAFTFNPDAGGYLLFFGRIHPHKGTHLAIEVARRAGLPLIVAGIVQDEAYFREQVEPHVDGDNVRYVGPVGPADRDRLLGHARALLHLISFSEPFGLSVVEALATGTPVIATPLGSMPELISHGTTGFLVSDADEAVSALPDVLALDRRNCRLEAETRFSSERMVDDYERVFRQIVTRT